MHSSHHPHRHLLLSSPPTRPERWLPGGNAPSATCAYTYPPYAIHQLSILALRSKQAWRGILRRPIRRWSLCTDPWRGRTPATQYRQRRQMCRSVLRRRPTTGMIRRRVRSFADRHLRRPARRRRPLHLPSPKTRGSCVFDPTATGCDWKPFCWGAPLSDQRRTLSTREAGAFGDRIPACPPNRPRLRVRPLRRGASRRRLRISPAPAPHPPGAASAHRFDATMPISRILRRR
mmetsp:Transcript_50696/g.152686  ORF Transcript_50696/g.152686 Transcript_50696/m.152686 type:complete len:233 (+) Transcript_50696:2159-2857(+)